MTLKELNVLNQRVKEIAATIDRCDADRDADVLDNLERELNEKVSTLEKALVKAKIRESGLKLIHGGAR